MFPQRLLRDPRFGLLSAESQVVYGQIWKRELRAPEGADLVGVIVSSCEALGPDPRARVERNLGELRKAGLLLEQPDGAVVPAHAPAARGIPAAGAVPQLRPDQLGPRGGRPGWLRTRESRAAAAARKAAAAAAAQTSLPLDPPPTAPPPAEPVTAPVTAPVSVTVTGPSQAVSGDVSPVARAHPLSPPPGLLEKPRGREGDAPEGGAEQRPGNGARNSPGNGSPRSAEELARLEPRALGRLLLDVLRARNLGKVFDLAPPSYEVAALGQVIAESQATEEELRAVGARWAHDPEEARKAIAWDVRVRKGERVRVSLLIGKHRNGQWQGKAFHDVLSDTRAWMERVREAKAKAAAAPHQHELGIPENAAETTGPPGVARAGDVPTRARASGDGSG